VSHGSDVNRQVAAHLLAAARNPLKYAQHLKAATQLCEANGIPHFGRYSEASITRREVEFAEREKLRKAQNRAAVKESGTLEANKQLRPHKSETPTEESK
jgi:hypothetical protein